MSSEFPEVTPAEPQSNAWFSESGNVDVPTVEQVPDHTAAPDEPADKPKRERPSLTLGKNKRPRSGVRALTQADEERLRNWYTGIALMLAPIRRDASMAIMDNQDKCVEAWFDLAAQNDRVRAFLLGMLEGGAWSKLIGAHMPILYAAVPPEMWERMPGLSAFTPPTEAPTDE